jgi:hypothetical protein
MRFVHSWVFPCVAGAALFAASLLLPARWRPYFEVGLAAVPLGLVLVLVVWFICSLGLLSRRMRQVTPLPPAPPRACPSCGGTEHEYKVGGHWHGAPDPVTGKRPGGWFSYGVCKSCNSRWGQQDGGASYVPSVEEWEGYVAGPAARREAQFLSWNNRTIDWPDSPAPAADRAATSDLPVSPETVNP